VKPGSYQRPPILDWSEIGLKWLTGSFSTSGVDSHKQCAFLKGDIFYLQATHEVQVFTVNDMMSFGAEVLWSEPPQTTLVHDSFQMSGFLRTQLFGQFIAPHDLLAQVPQKLNKSAMFELHSRMPSLFCHPDRAADARYVQCVRKFAEKALARVASVNDIDQTKFAHLQNKCGRRLRQKSLP